MMRQLANVITVTGLILRLFFVFGILGPWSAIVGTAMDVLDGRVARRYGTATVFGAELDWHADCAVAALATMALLSGAPIAVAVPALVGLTILWALNKSRGRRVSMAATTMLLLVARRLTEGV